MKKYILFVSMVLLLVSAGYGFDQPVINPEELSIKAGPTDPGEGLNLLWVESFIFPKVVKDENIISLGVRLTSKVKAVEASFDVSDEKVALSSNDGLNWSAAFKVPESAEKGMHLVRYTITDRKGSIQRSVEYFMDKNGALAEKGNGIAYGESIQPQGWSLTVTSTCSALVGASGRILYKGQKVVGFSKVPWYKVVFEDGEEGWIMASLVKEPADEYFELGLQSYHEQNYKVAIEYFQDLTEMETNSVRGNLWLAKSYFIEGDIDSAYREIKQAIRLNDRDINTRVFANSLAEKYFTLARAKYLGRKYNEAIAAYQKALDLNPKASSSWVELGKSYSRLGFNLSARNAWREALSLDPSNKEIYALLGVEANPAMIAAAKSSPAKQVKAASAAKAPVITANLEKPEVKTAAPAMANDSLQIVKGEKTQKGTSIESALKSVIALTKSFGTPVMEKGWQIKKNGGKFLVRFLCEQGEGVIETFEWLVDVDTKHVSASNANAQLLMNRW